MQSTYGNGETVSYDYDSLDRVTADRYNGNIRYKFDYNADGNVGYVQDLVNGVNYKYIYDTSDRLVKVEDSNGNTTKYDFDANNNVSKVTENIDNTIRTTTYGYDRDNRLKTITGNNNDTETYEYDSVGRLFKSTMAVNGIQYITQYNYQSGLNGSSTTKVSSINNNGNIISYTYDKNGNIETITQNGKVITYKYDELNELIREDNQVTGKTMVYSYDAGGNFTGKTEYAYTTGTPVNPTATHSYVYGDTNWKDKLTSYDGNTINYDAIGNPTSYAGWTFSWEEGRQLSGMSGNGYSIGYKYNSDGIRTQKTVNGVTTNYHLVGDKVTQETNGTDIIYYTYDSKGNLISMNLNGMEYYYIRNAQGDIIGLYDNTGAQVVSYTYDSWGKLISATGTLASTVGAKNPYRYRGYRYDTETGLYYLQSRYYNPEWGRFLNEDANAGYMGELLSQNVFAYTANNPINREDPNGTSFIADAGGCGFGAEIEEGLLDGLLENELDKEAEIDVIKETTAENESVHEEKITAAKDYVENKRVNNSESEAVTTSKETNDNKHYTPDQQAVIELAKEAKKLGGISLDDANILKQWADDYNVPNHGPEEHPNRPGANSNVPHIHIGKIGHIPIF